MVVETDTMEQLVKFLDPVIDLGDYEVRPVLNFSTAIASLSNSWDIKKIINPYRALRRQAVGETACIPTGIGKLQASHTLPQTY